MQFANCFWDAEGKRISSASQPSSKSLPARIRPELVLVSAGFDSHRADPIGSLGLETEDFAELTTMVKSIAAAHAGGRIVSILEGGYNPPVLAECVETHLRGLMEN